GIDIRGGTCDLVLNDRGQGDPYGPVPLFLSKNLSDSPCYRVWGGWFRRRDPDLLIDELAVVEIDARTLNTRTADVNAEADIFHGDNSTCVVKRAYGNDSLRFVCLVSFLHRNHKP